MTQIMRPVMAHGKEGLASEALEDVVIGTLEYLSERGQLAHTDIIHAGFDMGIEIPCHINPLYL